MPAFVSVVIGTYGGRFDELRRWSLGSVAGSTYPGERFEILIVDNNRDPHQFPRLQGAFAGGRVRVIREPRPGISRMRNWGIAAARGDVVAFIDDDCEVDPGWVARIGAAACDPGLAFGGGNIFDTAQGRLLRNGRPPADWGAERTLMGGNLWFRRRLFDRYRFDAAIRYGCEDYDLVYRLLLDGHRFAFDPHPILHHRSPSPYRAEGSVELSAYGQRVANGARAYFNLKRQLYAGAHRHPPSLLRAFLAPATGDFGIGVHLRARWSLYRDLRLRVRPGDETRDPGMGPDPRVRPQTEP